MNPRAARIAVLPERVKNQIAAGEVVERPASVVKELVENAIDAGARDVVVDLEEGGVRLVRVRDDGGGMSREDLVLAFAPHATSKLFETGDLEHIASLGFRGEALASIGAVARCRIVSKERGAPLAHAIENEGGTIGPVLEAGGAQGTLIEVRDLFYNVPARRRFLKQTATELARSLDVLQRMALARDALGLVVTHDGKRLYDVEASMDLRARIRRTFGAELADSLVPVAASTGGIELSGYIAPPRFARSDALRQMWFLNGRTVRDKVLLRALKDGYRGFLLDGRQPVAFLSLALDPARVDVNVHPAKSEVRFRDERAVFGLVVAAVRDALRAGDLATPGARLIETAERREQREWGRQQDFASSPRGAGDSREPRWRDPAARETTMRYESAHAAATHDSWIRETPERFLEPRPGAPAPRPLSDSPWSAAGPERARASEPDHAAHGPYLQIANTYLVRALDGGFEIVDQHALHERITYEGLLADLRAGRTETQRLLVPELVEASRAEVELVAASFAALAKVGIELAVFGETTLAVHGLPARLARPDPAGIVRDVISVLESARTPRAEELLESVLHRAACRSSVMAGDPLSQAEIESLIERGRALESDQTCVHGRPTRVRFTLADLERAFQRR